MISKFMRKDGPLEVLCVIPIREILTKGISYVRSKIDEGSYVEKFNCFWTYFRMTWMTKYDTHSWNIHDIVSNEDNEMLINRTNNACEAFNRRLNENIGHAHPTMPILIKVLNKMSCDYANKMTIVEQSR